MPGRVLRSLVFVLSVTALIWGAAIVYWQETHRLVTPDDVALYLIGLPLAAIAAWYLGRAVWRRAAASGSGADAAAGAGAAPAAAAQQSLDAGERAYTVALAAAALRTAAAQSAEALLAALEERAVKPQADLELKDGNGFALRSARVADLDIAAVEEWWAEYAQRGTAATSLAAAPQRLLRALALLQAPLAHSVEALTALCPAAANEDAASAAAPAPRRLMVAVAAPQGLGEAGNAALRAFVETQLAPLAWPLPQLSITLLAPAYGSAIGQMVDRYAVTVNRESLQDVLLLAGCDSLIDGDTAARLEAEHKLFTPGHQQGIVPGEAAATALFLPGADGGAAARPPALIHRAAIGTRDKSADGAGRIAPDLVCALTQQALAAAALPPSAIGGVVTDCDHRSSRVIETAGMMNRLLPELEPMADRISLGDAIGNIGAAAPVLLFALAAERAKAQDKPQLLVTVAHSTERCACVVAPLAPQPAAQPAPA